MDATHSPTPESAGSPVALPPDLTVADAPADPGAGERVRYLVTVEERDIGEGRSFVTAVATIEWDGGKAEVITNLDREPVEHRGDGHEALMFTVARAVLDLLPIVAWEGDYAEGVFEVVDGEAVEVVAREAA